MGAVTLEDGDMGFLAAVAVVLMGVVSPVNAIADQVAENTLRRQIYSAETLAVRVDNAPNYRIVQGRVQRVRVAGKGVMPIEGVRIEQLGLEAEAIALNPQALRDGTVELDRPLELAAQIILTEADLNQALQAPAVVDQLQSMTLQLPGAAAFGIERYILVDPQVDLQGGDRLQFSVTLQERRTQRRLQIQVASGLEVLGGQRLRLVDPAIQIDGQAVPAELLAAFTRGSVVDLQRYADDGFLARLLQLEIREDEMAIAAWVQVQPQVFSEN